MKMKAVIIGGTFCLALFIYAKSRSEAVRFPNLISTGIHSENRVAPDFELRTLDGRRVKLSDFRGKAVVLNFWATYCGPCRVEMPWLIDLYKQYQSRGLEIVGISMDDDGEQRQVADFVREFGVNYTVLLGNHFVGEAYGGARLLPQTFLIDREGHIEGSAIGMKHKREFEELINQLLAHTT